MRRGILLKSPTALERLAAIDTVVFDKTGTLSLGQLELCRDAAIDPQALRLAASLAAASRHPLAQALHRACPDVPALADVMENPGQGLSCCQACGKVRLGSRAFCGVEGTDDDAAPELWLAVPGETAVRFVFRDRLRPDAGAVVHHLQRAGMRVLLLSGDRDAAVTEAAVAVGISECRAGLSPTDKYSILADLAADGRKVLMVGDGLNDAPSLAAAHASLSPATAADVSQTAADVVFQGQSLNAVTEVLDVARSSARLVRQNIAFAILYNALVVPLAMLGQVTPLLAAAAMSTSSLIVVCNALRISVRHQ
jgi:P-type Cu2+ transporter